MKTIQAVQHVRRMRGGAQSHLMRSNDGFYYVVKFQNNPQDTRVLANEMLATRLAQHLGIPVPEPAVIEVSSWLIDHTEELHCQLGSQRIPCVSGPCFGSRFASDPDQGAVFDYLPGNVLCKVANLEILRGCSYSTNGHATAMDGRQSSQGREAATRLLS